MKGPIVVTGGLGFIGSAFVRAVAGSGVEVHNVDARTYAADDHRIGQLTEVTTTEMDVVDTAFTELVASVRPAAIVHFAAETHVTRGETDQDRFFRTNVEGTKRVLDAATAAGVERVVHVSTDEVYGPALDHPFTEDEKSPGEGKATSAYARSKAIADELARSYADALHVDVVRPTNCFGPWQHPEKAVPRWVTRALSGRRLPVWGDGNYVRDWMFVDDACSAILTVLEKSGGGVFNIGPENQAMSNVEIAAMIAIAGGADPDAVYLSAYDRPRHDRRYSVDTAKIRALGWHPRTGVTDGIAATVEWYRANRAWWEPLVASAEALYADQAERA